MQSRPCRGTDHVDELGDGQAEVDQHHVGGVGDGPRQLVIADEQVLQQALLCVAPGPLRTHWGHHRFTPLVLYTQ